MQSNIFHALIFALALSVHIIIHSIPFPVLLEFPAYGSSSFITYIFHSDARMSRAARVISSFCSYSCCTSVIFI
jgi:hypothetical protein